MMKNRETVGKISSDLINKTPDSVDPVEIEREMQGDYGKNLLECWNTSRNTYGGDFFIIVITKKEPLMPNVLRNYFFSRESCPSPDYDQAVYHYRKNDDVLDFLWVIPSKDACLMFIDQASSIVPGEWGLLAFVLKFADGSLYRLSKRLNNEIDDSALLIS